MLFRSFSLLFLFLLAYCKDDAPVTNGGAPLAATDKPSFGDANALRLVPRISQTATRVGEALVVRCEVWQGRNRRADLAVRGEISPRQAVIDYRDNVTTFSLTRAGSLKLSCRLADAEADRDPLVVRESQTLVVQKGPAAALQVELPRTEMAAGEELPPFCLQVDAFGNPSEGPRDSVGPLQPHIVHADANDRRPVAPGHPAGEPLRLVEAGDYLLSCTADGLRASPPRRLRVVPAAATALSLAVTDEQPQAGRPFAARCQATDAYGNSLGAHRMALQVEPHLPRPGRERIEQVGEEGLILFTKGTYTLRCDSVEAAEQGRRLRSAERLVQVRGGEPARMDVKESGWGLTDQNVCLSEEQFYGVASRVYDAYDNLLSVGEEYALDITATGAGAAERSPVSLHPAGVAFHAPGTYQLSAQVRPPYAAGSTLGAQALTYEVDVNSSLPTIHIDSPARAAQVIGEATGSGASVRLRGHIEDAVGLASVTVMGKRIDFDSAARPQRYALDVEVPNLHWGVNLIEISASNRCNTARRVQSFEYAPRFVDPREAAQADLAAQALQLQLGPDMLNRRDDPALTSVARLLEAALTPELLAGRIPQQLGSSGAGGGPSNGWLPHHIERRGEVEFATPVRVRQLCIEPVQPQQPQGEQQLHLQLRIDAVKVPIYVNWLLLKGEATFYVPHVAINVRLRANAAGQPQIDAVDGVTVAFMEKPRLEWGSQTLRKWRMHLPLQQIIDAGAFLVRKNNLFQDTLTTALRGAILSALHDAVDALDWEGHPYMLPKPLQGGVQFTRARNRLKLLPQGTNQSAHVAVAIDGSLLPAGAAPVQVPPALREIWRTERPTLPVSLGAIRHAAAEPSLALPESAAFGIMVHDDVVNAFLWAMWQSGGFDLPRLHALIGTLGAEARLLLNGSELQMFATAPPVVEPSAVANRFVLSWGDLYLRGDVNTANSVPNLHPLAQETPGPERVPVAMFVSFKLEVELHFDRVKKRFVVKMILPPTPPATTPDQAVREALPGPFRIEMVDLKAHNQMNREAALRLQGWLPDFIPGLIEKFVNGLPPPTVDISAILGKGANSTGWRTEAGVLSRPAQQPFTLLQGGVELMSKRR